MQKDLLKNLEHIYNKMGAIGEETRREGAVMEAELSDRLAKGLTGDAAIEHYNQWMIAAGLSHLAVMKS